jgi:hypothetical protein
MARTTRNLGLLLLGIYLIIIGLVGLFGLAFPYQAQVLALLALIAGILLLVGR